MATQRDIDMLKNRLVDVMREYGVELSGGSEKFLTACPFHEDSDPSFSVYARGTWRCFAGCSGTAQFNHQGDVFSFVALMEKLDIERDFPEIIRITADKIGYRLEPDPHEKKLTPSEKQARIETRDKKRWLMRAGEQVRAILADIFHAELLARRDRAEYLMHTRRRALNTLSKFKIGWTPADAKKLAISQLRADGCDWSDTQMRAAFLASGMFSTGDDGKLRLFFRDSFLFPSFGADIDDLFTGQTRPSVITFRRKLPPGSTQKNYQIRANVDIDGRDIPTCTNGRRPELLLYNARALHAETVFVVEGEHDVLALYEAIGKSMNNFGVVGICGGTGRDPESLRAFANARRGENKITILAFDADHAGFQYADAFGDELMAAGVPWRNIRAVAWWECFDWKNAGEYCKDIDELITRNPNNALDKITANIPNFLDWLLARYDHAEFEEFSATQKHITQINELDTPAAAS